MPSYQTQPAPSRNRVQDILAANKAKLTGNGPGEIQYRRQLKANELKAMSDSLGQLEQQRQHFETKMSSYGSKVTKIQDGKAIKAEFERLRALVPNGELNTKQKLISKLPMKRDFKKELLKRFKDPSAAQEMMNGLERTREYIDDVQQTIEDVEAQRNNVRNANLEIMAKLSRVCGIERELQEEHAQALVESNKLEAAHMSEEQFNQQIEMLEDTITEATPEEQATEIRDQIKDLRQAWNAEEQDITFMDEIVVQLANDLDEARSYKRTFASAIKKNKALIEQADEGMRDCRKAVNVAVTTLEAMTPSSILLGALLEMSQQTKGAVLLVEGISNLEVEVHKSVTAACVQISKDVSRMLDTVEKNSNTIQEIAGAYTKGRRASVKEKAVKYQIEGDPQLDKDVQEALAVNDREELISSRFGRGGDAFDR